MIEVCTLVDITKTDIRRNNRPHQSLINDEEWGLKRNQQRNLDTFIQLLGLRFLPDSISVLSFKDTQNPYIFGDYFSKYEKLSYWKCICNYPSEINLSSIIEDFNEIPIIIHLAESVSFLYPLLLTDGEFKNVTFRKLNISNLS